MPARLALLFSLFTALPALADGGTIRFEGQIIEAACTVTIEPTKTAANIHVTTSAANDACSRGAPAFTTQVGSLDGSQTDLDNPVITITYN